MTSFQTAPKMAKKIKIPKKFASSFWIFQETFYSIEERVVGVKKYRFQQKRKGEIIFLAPKRFGTFKSHRCRNSDMDFFILWRGSFSCSL